MNMQGDIIQRFHAALPEVRRWLDDYLDDHFELAFQGQKYSFWLRNCWTRQKTCINWLMPAAVGGLPPQLRVNVRPAMDIARTGR